MEDANRNIAVFKIPLSPNESRGLLAMRLLWKYNFEANQYFLHDDGPNVYLSVTGFIPINVNIRAVQRELIHLLGPTQIIIPAGKDLNVFLEYLKESGFSVIGFAATSPTEIGYLLEHPLGFDKCWSAFDEAWNQACNV